MMAGDSKKFLERFPMQPLPYLTNSHANMMLGNYEEAVAIAKEGLEISMLKNDRTQLLITLGTAYYEIKEFAKSDKAHDELLELSPNDDLGLNNYAFFLAERKVRLSDAQTMIEKALSISPANASYLDTYGWVWYQLEDYEKAVIYFNKAMQMDPTDLEILNHLAMSYDKLGKKNEASEVRKRIEEIEKSLDTGI
jgi:tetratricopeptide (TPR) repeat protein